MTILTPYPILTTVYGIPLYSHGLLFVLGVLLGYAVLYRFARLRGLPRTDLFFNLVVIFAAGIVGARLGYVLIYPAQFHSWYEVLAMWQGGLLSYTGIIAGLGALLWLYPERRKDWLDGAMLAGLVGWAIGRLGNYYTMDSGGVRSSFWTAFYGQVPIQLFESGLCLALFIGLLLLHRKRPRPAGRLFLWGSLGYLGGRLIIDTWRAETAFWGLHLSQWACLFFLFLIAIIWFGKKRLV